MNWVSRSPFRKHIYGRTKGKLQQRPPLSTRPESEPSLTGTHLAHHVAESLKHWNILRLTAGPLNTHRHRQVQHTHAVQHIMFTHTE